MNSREDRRVWAALLYPATVPEVIGAMRGSLRLHWTAVAARAEVDGWLSELGIEGRMGWEMVEDDVFIGRHRGHTAIIRSILLPLGPPPAATTE